ncbi:tryptophan--tRNA ligase [Sphingosinicella rhizophila]|uniref:Tryptophan--tRNA ligase n=1 Tax=Sphingosinicella rhizophila TaxID=3050082 RepID=A0ABU3Q506_9SPHN|nr:tryptophan--tRNA ligase [Sphingosinicella sp. GR2756]MDT9598491.1 tryptophan--tRNA ligase [Sphingosinicella sp. GR2756]
MRDPSRHEELTFSGIQPTGTIHLGNYLGAIRNWVAMQDEGNCIFCVVDLHAITIPQVPEELRSHIREIAAALIACGLDPDKVILFRQSQVSAHAELWWILNSIASMGWLNRMTQFKQKAGKDQAEASVGLFAYPVLQAADVLTYKTTHVPVGEDQRQHIELARDIAMRFNTIYATEFFPLPEAVIPKDAARVMSLVSGQTKMSKSDQDDNSRINLLDDPSLISEKIARACDGLGEISGSQEDLATSPKAENLVRIYAALAQEDVGKVVEEFGGSATERFQRALADRLVAELSPISQEFQRLLSDKAHLDRILAAGADKARSIADPILDDVYDIIGMSRRSRFG